MNAFITRAQSPDSEFTRLLEAQGWQVQGEPLVTLAPLPFVHVPECEWIFFASKNAVHFFFGHVHQSRLALPAVRWAALGEATAEALTRYVRQVDFVGNGEPEAAARAFQAYADSAVLVRVLFPAARHSMQSVAGCLSGNFRALHLEVYDNQPLPNPAPRTADVLVFTSPMNAQAYFSHHARLPGQKIVAIGATTAEALARLGFSDVLIAAEPNERSLAKSTINSGI